MSVASILGFVAPALNRVLSFIPDPNARALAEAEFSRAMLEAGHDQREINKEEARHHSLFVAGWRPFVGWCCSGCILYGYLAQPWLAWLAAMYAPEHMDKIPEFPMENVMELIFGLLGLGSLRTFEKYKGVAK